MFNPVFFILLILLLPNSSFEFFHIFACILIFFQAYNQKPTDNKYSKFILFFITFIILCSSIRFFSTLTVNIRDFKEAFRYVPIALLYIYINAFKNIKLLHLIDAMFIYLLIDGIVSYAQFNNLGLYVFDSILLKFYNSDIHTEISLGVAHRTLGLSSGPGQHGALISLIYTFMLTSAMLIKEKRPLTILSIIISFNIIISSQSRTSFIAICLVTVAIFCFFFVINNIKSKLALILLASFLLLFYFTIFEEYIEKYRYLVSVYSNKTVERVKDVRLNKSERHISKALYEKPLWLLIGHGKDFFGNESAAMDNEYIYLLAVYGIGFVGTLIYILLLFFYDYYIKFKSNKIKSFPSVIIIFFIVLVGLIIGFPSAFFTEPKILILFSILIIIKFWENYDYKKQIIFSEQQAIN